MSLVRYHAFCPFLGAAHLRRALVATAGNLVTLDEPLRLVRDKEVALAHLHTGGRIGGAVRSAMRLTGLPYVISIHGPLLAQRAWLEADTARRLRGLVDLGRPFGALFGARRVLQDAARVFTTWFWPERWWMPPTGSSSSRPSSALSQCLSQPERLAVAARAGAAPCPGR